ncbi:MAG: hypothetical protein U9N73_11980, partial [Candidatus Auribacterota bacterium]|nr:hypothetical protein [Candidatus Auribacterota bacterium]
EVGSREWRIGNGEWRVGSRQYDEKSEYRTAEYRISNIEVEKNLGEATSEFDIRSSIFDIRF